jgi:hypothetical protein
MMTTTRTTTITTKDHCRNKGTIIRNLIEVANYKCAIGLVNMKMSHNSVQHTKIIYTQQNVAAFSIT